MSKRSKRVKKQPKQYLFCEEGGSIGGRSIDIASANPDVLAEGQTLWPARDEGQEAQRQVMIEKTQAALASLSPREREVVALMVRPGMTELKGAGILGISRGAFATMLQRARKKVSRICIPNGQLRVVSGEGDEDEWD